MEINFFALLEEILHTPEIEKRFKLIELLQDFHPSLIQTPPQALKTIQFDSSNNTQTPRIKHYTQSFYLDHSHSILPITTPIYQGICPILHPRKISRSKVIDSDGTMGAFLHSIAHIEYSAIDLALDASYRFRNLPMEYYHNWIEVALEEVSHFNFLRDLLQRTGYDYGDFAVHSNLFDAMKATPIFADRMALVHRGMEANGLDANPFVAQKVAKSNHPLRDEILQVLEIILRDEISHVSKGDQWWRFSKDTRSFKEILELYGQSLPKTLNIQARLQCGFSLDEIDALKSQ